MDSDGETRYYVDGVAAYAGLVYWDGYFYYFNSSLKAVRNRTYWPTNTNGLIPVAEYTFDENGRITNPPVVGIDAQGQLKNGIYADADGEIRYYVDGIATYAKLVYANGHYYYIGSSLKAVRDTTHWVSATNGLMAAGNYTFDAQGRMVNPPADALTEPVSTFALTGETMSKTYEYIYASGTLMRQTLTVTIGNSTTTYAMDFFYDASGYPFAVKYNGDLCYYITNLQGDVMSIVDAQGEVVAEYEYDPYGNIISQSGPLAEANPLRYRGYVFDSETGLYYLQSRYYDPEIGRFINADALVSTGQGVLGNNMFAYCGNSPVSKYDPSGHAFTDIYAVCYGDAKRNTRTTFSDGQEQSDELLQYILDYYIPTNGYSANAHVEYLGIYSKQSNILADISMSLGGKIATYCLSLSNLGIITKMLLHGVSFLSSAYGDIGLLNDAVDAMNDLSDKDYHQYKVIISWTQIDNVEGFPGAVRYTYYYAEYTFLWNDTRYGQEHWFILSHTANISEETHGIN